ncbi:hypothetical protein N431DRAFT_409679 [Stipitochalara longipes BDJ]|nr:hypothetical protein N431DRAFT_409679 [Stipitochalara longipes BDJ]
MPSTTPLSTHPVLQKIFLISLSAFLFPLITALTLFSAFISPWLASTKHINHTRRWRAISSTFQARTILVTNLCTPESLSLARTFHCAGHKVIGAAYEEYYFLIPAHFSRAVDVFYRLGSAKGSKGREWYVRDLVDVAKKEGVEIWGNCSHTDVDLEVKEVLEQETDCKVFQFKREVTELLGDEAAALEHIKTLGLNVAEQHLITSEEAALAIIYPEEKSSQGKQYTVRSAFQTESTSSEMALLPLSSQKDIRTYVKALQPSSSNPLLLQEAFPDHQQYTVYALVRHGKPAAFVAYPTSATILTPLPSTSLLAQALLQYTTLLTTSLPSSQAGKTGHIALYFTIHAHLSLPAESKFGASSTAIASFLPQIYLLSSSLSLDLGTLALRDVAEDLASVYLSILPDHEPKGISNGHWEERIVVPRPGVRGYYFLGREVVRLVLVQTWGLLRWELGVKEVIKGWIEFAEFVVGWREGWWELWDPWVAWWRYGGYVVGRAMIGIWERRGWNDENGGADDTLVRRA